MGTEGLYIAVKAGAPLVEIVVRFYDSVDAKEATDKFNSLGVDIHLQEMDWYNDSHLRVGAATKEALDRLFSWKLKRVHTGPPNNPGPIFMWEEIGPPERYPEEVARLIKSIGFSQPGSDDEGQWYE